MKGKSTEERKESTEERKESTEERKLEYKLLAEKESMFITGDGQNQEKVSDQMVSTRREDGEHKKRRWWAQEEKMVSETRSEEQDWESKDKRKNKILARLKFVRIEKVL